MEIVQAHARQADAREADARRLTQDTGARKTRKASYATQAHATCLAQDRHTHLCAPVHNLVRRLTLSHNLLHPAKKCTLTAIVCNRGGHSAID